MEKEGNVKSTPKNEKHKAPNTRASFQTFTKTVMKTHHVDSVT
jgi:hypothetical protein